MPEPTQGRPGGGGRLGRPRRPPPAYAGAGSGPGGGGSRGSRYCGVRPLVPVPRRPSQLHVVVATAGRPDLLGRALDSLAACRRPETYADLVVVENGPRTGAEAAVAGADPWLSARYVHAERPGKSAALNRAVEEAGDGLVVFVDDDVRAHPDVLVAYAAAAERAADGRAYFGGSCRADYEAQPPAHVVRHLPVSARGFDPRRSSDGFYLGLNWAAFADDLRRAGGFDPRFGPGSATGATGGDETAVQIELQKRGVVPTPVPEAVVWHYVPRDRCSEPWLLRRGYRDGLSHAQFAPSDRRFGGAARSVLSAGWNGLAALYFGALRDDDRRLRASVASRFRAGYVRGLVRERLRGS